MSRYAPCPCGRRRGRCCGAVVIAALGLALLAGCSDKDEPGTLPKTPKPSSTSASPTPATPEEEVEAAVRAYYAELTRAAQTNDATVLEDADDYGCPCYRAVKVIKRNEREGETTPMLSFDLHVGQGARSRTTTGAGRGQDARVLRTTSSTRRARSSDRGPTRKHPHRSVLRRRRARANGSSATRSISEALMRRRFCASRSSRSLQLSLLAATEASPRMIHATASEHRLPDHRTTSGRSEPAVVTDGAFSFPERIRTARWVESTAENAECADCEWTIAPACLRVARTTTRCAGTRPHSVRSTGEMQVPRLHADSASAVAADRRRSASAPASVRRRWQMWGSWCGSGW